MPLEVDNDVFAGVFLIISSTKVFHEPQEGHRPSHLADSAAQFWQMYTVFSLAMS
jgi:hypothetical protein